MKDRSFTRKRNKMKILVTGGLGFIGSHTTVELVNEGFEVIIVDNLSNTSLMLMEFQI
jgi:UDP-glucose 4-epimerase